MKIIFAGLMVAAFSVLTGCSHGAPGGPAAATSDNSDTSDNEADHTFKLNMPMIGTKLVQGQSKNLAISVERGKKFNEDVTLSFEGMPKGATLDPATPVIMHGENATKITLKVAKDAASGTFPVKVTGHPTKGADSTGVITITIERR